jgi:hypothetical protein
LPECQKCEFGKPVPDDQKKPKSIADGPNDCHKPVCRSGLPKNQVDRDDRERCAECPEDGTKIPPPTDEECCDYFKDDTQDPGIAVCCRGAKIPCIYDERLPEGSETVVSIADLCVRQHEQYHIDHHLDCKGKCKSKGVGDPPPPNPPGPECEAYRDEIACYERMKSQCGSDKECIRRVKSFIKQARDHGKTEDKPPNPNCFPKK